MSDQRSLAAIYGDLPVEIVNMLGADDVSEIVRSVSQDTARLRRQAWLGLCLAFLALVVLSLLSWYYMHEGAPAQGAAIITGGAVAIVGLFVGTRATSRRRSRSSAQDRSARKGPGRAGREG